MVNAISKTSFRLASILTLALALCLALVPSAAAEAASAAPDALRAGVAVADGTLSDWLTGIALSLPLVGTVKNFVPEVWSQNLNLRFRKMRVFSVLTNSDYEGEISEAGDTVKIMRPDSIDIGDYDGSSITFQEATSTSNQLEITESKYFAFQLDDVDEVQANVNLVQTFTNEAADAAADVADQFVAGHYTGAGSVIEKQAITEENVYSTFVTAGERLDEKNVPQSGRVAVVSPFVYARIKEAPEFIKASDLGDQVVQTGALGQVAGFLVYMSNNVAVANDGADDVEHNLFGHPAAITFADQYAQVEALRIPDAFKDGVKGLSLYGAKVIRPEALVDVRRTV